MNRQRARARRNAHQSVLRHDRAGHAGAVRVWLVGPPDGVKSVCDRLLELRVRVVDFGIDHRNGDALAGCDLVHLGEAQLVRDVLLVISRGGVRRRGFSGLHGLVDVVRLRDDLLGLHRTHHIACRAIAADAEVHERAAGEHRTLDADDVQVVLARDFLDARLRDVRSPLTDHFGSDEARLGNRRNAGEIAFAGEGIGRKAGAKRQHVAAVREALHLAHLRRAAVHGAQARVAVGEAARLTEALGRSTTVESVAFDLNGLRLVVRNLVIADETAQRPLFALDQLVADVSAATLWQRAPVFDAVKLTRPRMFLARGRDGRYSVQDLVDRALAPRPPGPPPQFSFNNIEIEDGAITLDDRLADRRHEISALTIAVPFVSSLPYATDIRVTPHMEGTFNGSHFALKGSATPFAEHRETTLDIHLDALKLPPYVAYLPSRPTLELAGGALTTRLTIAFVEQGLTDRRLELRGNAYVDGLAIKRRDGTPLVAADRIAVALDRVGVFDRQARCSPNMTHLDADRTRPGPRSAPALTRS